MRGVNEETFFPPPATAFYIYRSSERIFIIGVAEQRQARSKAIFHR
jgi:hypothetical protein